jgi:hypothetical protein
MADSSIAFVETATGKFQFKAAMIKLQKLKVPATGDAFTMRMEDFAHTVAGSKVSREASTNATSKDMESARANFQQALTLFVDGLAEPADPPIPPPAPARAAGGAGRFAGASAFFFLEGETTGDARIHLGASSSSGAAAEDSPYAGKRRRLGMSDSDLARACSVMDLPASKATHQFLADKPLDVHVYTPLLVDPYASVRKALEAFSLLAREVLEFEGDILDLSPEAVAMLPTTPLFATCDLESGSRLLHRIEMAQAAATALRGKNLASSGRSGQPTKPPAATGTRGSSSATARRRMPARISAIPASPRSPHGKSK